MPLVRIAPLLVFIAALSAWPAYGASPREQDRAACASQPAQDQAACMREAAAARQEARRGRLDEGLSGEYEKNRVARCAYLPAPDQADCLRRMQGEGYVSGSVTGGGIYRELRTIVPAPEEQSGTGASGAAGSTR